MSNLNHVVLSGRATRDPELRNTPNGNSVVGFGIAVERYNKDDAENPYVGFYEVSVWGAFGELIAKKLSKGEKLTLTGRLDYSSWEAEDGSKRSKVSVVANQIEGEFMFKSAAENNTPADASEPAAGEDAKPADDDIPF